MVTTVKNTSFGSKKTEYQEPKRLSKAGQWMRENPGGIFIVKDWRAVNK